MEKIFSILIVVFLSGLLTPTILGLIKKYQIKKETKLDKNKFAMYHSTGLVLFMTILSIILAVIVILLNSFNAFDSRGQFLATNISIMPFIILFSIGAIIMAREKLIVDGDDILIIPAFRKKIKCSFSEITKLKESEWFSSGSKISMYAIYTTKKVYSISNNINGFHTFMQVIREKKIFIETIEEQIKSRHGNK